MLMIKIRLKLLEEKNLLEEAFTLKVSAVAQVK